MACHSCLVLMKNLPALREAFAFAVTELFADLVTDRAPVEYLLVLLCSGAPLIPTSITRKSCLFQKSTSE